MNNRMKTSSSSSYKESSHSDICDLPNEVLHNILGSLSIRELVRTCLLTKKWQQLWRSAPCLVFERAYMEPTSRFINLVHTVCTLRDPHYPIKTFALQYDHHIGLDHAPLIINAIETAVKGRVQDLWIDIGICEPYALPHCVFSSETLIKFHLSLPMHTRLILPDCVSLPKLKDLYLRNIVFADLRSIQQLCSCPLLEDLVIERCCWKSRDTTDIIGSAVTISAPNLKRLSFYSVKVMSPLRWVHCESLKEVHYLGRLNYEFDVSGMNKLDRVEVDLEKGTVAEHTMNLLNCLSSITRRLTLSSESEVFDSWRHLSGLTGFDKLIELTLVGCMSFFETVYAMLRKSPCLEIFNLRSRHENYVTDDPGLEDPDPLHHLKKITITYTQGFMDIAYIVPMLLRCCPLLEVMVLKVPQSWATDLSTAVTNLPKVSQHCTIVYRYY